MKEGLESWSGWFPSQCAEEGCNCGENAYPKHWYVSSDGYKIVFFYECNGHEWKETYEYQGKDYLN